MSPPVNGEAATSAIPTNVPFRKIVKQVRLTRHQQTALATHPQPEETRFN